MFTENEEKSKLVNEISSRRSELETHLKRIEKAIFDSETKYLESSQYTGNILRGWEQIFAAKSKISPQTTQIIPKRTKFSINDKIFSQTSFSNSYLKDESNLSHISVRTNNYQANSVEGNKDNFLRKKIKKKIYSSLSLKKKKSLSGGVSLSTRNDQSLS